MILMDCYCFCFSSNRWPCPSHSHLTNDNSIRPSLLTLRLLRMEPSRRRLGCNSLGLRGLLPLWSQVRAMWLLIWWPLEAYMVVNFRAREISRGTRKLARTPTLIKKQFIENVTLKGVAQLVRSWICSLKVISLSPTNLRATKDLHGH